MKISKIQKHGQLRNWIGQRQVTTFLKIQISFIFHIHNYQWRKFFFLKIKKLKQWFSLIFSAFIPLLRPTTKSAPTADHYWTETGFYRLNMKFYRLKHNRENRFLKKILCHSQFLMKELVSDQINEKIDLRKYAGILWHLQCRVLWL